MIRKLPSFSPSLAPAVLRLTMAGVFMWFGVSQVTAPMNWIGFVPDLAISLSGLSTATLVILNGGIEIVGSIFLATNLWSRWAALILGVHLFGIAATLGWNAIGVRDFGLALATLTIFLDSREWRGTFDRSIKRRI
ncbi:MAG: DoxX family protein [Candidatus Liptonbacteria bacterium]|nr:DoxX family protein [Candidatus Liptonbacteria bacterium]